MAGVINNYQTTGTVDRRSDVSETTNSFFQSVQITSQHYVKRQGVYHMLVLFCCLILNFCLSQLLPGPLQALIKGAVETIQTPYLVTPKTQKLVILSKFSQTANTRFGSHRF